MADAIISAVVQQFTDIALEKIIEEVKLLRRVEKEVSYLTSNLNVIVSELDDAERRGYKEKSIQRWLGKLEDLAYDIADLLDEWNLEILKHGQTEGEEEGPSGKVSPCIPSCLCFRKVAKRHEIAKKIEDLKKRMKTIVKDKNKFKLEKGQPSETRKPYRVSSPSVDELEIQGRGAEKDGLVRKLILEGAGQEELGLGPPVIVVQGAGGIGKTTLAQLVYKDDRVVKYFEKRIWVCVSNISDEVKIAKGIIEQVSESSPNLNELGSCLERVRDSISGKKFLLVLDDVWEEYCDKWGSMRNNLKCGAPGSKILITTRSETVARLMSATEIHKLGLLSDEDCWLLMSRIAFSGRRDENSVRFQDIGKNIAGKCKGLPLAAKVLGSYLCFKDTMEEWENVLTSDIWQLEKVELELFPHLFLSYNELSPPMKRCFSYCAIFPKDFVIDVDKLIRMWMALGYLGSDKQEIRGKDYFDNLIMRSLFQKHEAPYFRLSGNNFCGIHDVVHDFAIFLRKNKSYDLGYPDKRVEAASKMSSQACDPSLISQVKEFRSLVCDEGKPPLHKFDCAAVLRVLSLYGCRLEEIPEDVENLIHLRYLDLSLNWNLRQIPRVICKLYYLESLYLVNCGLTEIPEEIENLIHLTHLDLSENDGLKKLTKAICNLRELRNLGLGNTNSLTEFPEGIERLVNLKHILNGGYYYNNRLSFPEGLKKLTNLRTLEEFYCESGDGGSKLEYLNKLNRLSGDLRLDIEANGVECVVHARKAELRNKIGITTLELSFERSTFLYFSTGERRDDQSLINNDILEALEPPPMLENLEIYGFSGTKLPGWITSSSLNHLTTLRIWMCHYCSTLPPLRKLPCLEELRIVMFDKLVQLDREFLGITETTTTPPTPPSSSSVPNHHDQALIGFRRLKLLRFVYCYDWREWEDITAEEEGNPYLSIMPCLEGLQLNGCDSIEALPHRLLRKASSLRELRIESCPKLLAIYGDEESSARRSLSHIQRVVFNY